MRFSEPLECVGKTESDTERDSAGDRIIEGREQLVKNTASEVIGNTLITWYILKYACYDRGSGSFRLKCFRNDGAH